MDIIVIERSHTYMRSTWGRAIQYSLFGESHGPAIGITIHHLPAGFKPDLDKLRAAMARRKPGTGVFATKRAEKDEFEIISGYFQDALTGAPLTAIFRNEDTRSSDYEALKRFPRPSHADFAANAKYHGFNDPRGSGHFSGRLTAPLVFAGALAAQILEAQHGIRIMGHVAQVGAILDTPIDAMATQVTEANQIAVRQKTMPFFSDEAMEQASQMLEKCHDDGDSVGGAVEVGVTGLPVGWGDPVFEGIESLLGQLLFSVPAVKAVEFGAGTGFAAMHGSQSNDPWRMEGDQIVSETNHSGGINGGITNGMPMVLKVTFRPASSIALTQQTIDMRERINAELNVVGRHDPTIVVRAVPVIEAVTAIGLLEAKANALDLI
jgi:chorismate synthase